MLISSVLLFCKISLLFFISLLSYFDIDGDMIQKYGGATAASVSPFVVEFYRMIDYEYPFLTFPHLFFFPHFLSSFTQAKIQPPFHRAVGGV